MPPVPLRLVPVAGGDLGFIGNDVVDLRAPGALGKWRDERFLRRVFSEPELRAIGRARDPDLAVWAAWAAKEAVFKIACRGCPGLIFSHRRFEVDEAALGGLDDARGAAEGAARFEEGSYALSWSISESVIHCVALEAGVRRDGVRSWVLSRGEAEARMKSLPAGFLAEEELASAHSRESVLVRAMAKLLFAEAEQRPAALIRPCVATGPDGHAKWGPPVFVMREGRSSGVEVSLSHDGDWLAIALRGVSTCV